MDRDVEVVQLVIVIALFALVTIMGFVAARWQRGEHLDDLHEWGLGGRRFGGWITWFLLGGDVYTAYTFVAVPALVFGMGAVGFFAVPYTIIVYPMVMLAAIRMWSVAHAHGYVTPADFVAHRFGSSSLALALALTLGYMAIEAGITPVDRDPNTVVPLLYDASFPSWFAGIAFGAIAIGALVPAAIMSIAAANLFTRNIYRQYLRKDATPAQEARVSKLTSLVVKAGALVVILSLDPQFSIDLQLIGGVIILQTLPALVLGLWRTFAHRWALLAGWAVGLIAGMWMLYDTPNPNTGKEHFGGAQYALDKLGLDSDWTVYTGILALAANLLVVIVGSLILRAAGAPPNVDETRSEDYEIDAGDPRAHDLPATPQEAEQARREAH